MAQQIVKNHAYTSFLCRKPKHSRYRGSSMLKNHGSTPDRGDVTGQCQSLYVRKPRTIFLVSSYSMPHEYQLGTEAFTAYRLLVEREKSAHSIYYHTDRLDTVWHQETTTTLPIPTLRAARIYPACQYQPSWTGTHEENHVDEEWNIWCLLYF